MKTKFFNMLLTFVLIASALSVVQTSLAATTTETIDFSSSCWGISYQNYVNGTFYDHGYTIDGYQLKYNTYVDAVMLNYLGSSDRIGYGTITLPTFSETISAIKVYTVNATSSTLRYIDLYVDGVLQGTTKTHSVQPDAEHYTTPASWTGLSIAPGSTVMLKNVTNNNEFHIGSIEITHNGSTSLYQSTSIDGKGNVSATVTPQGAGTVSISPTRQNVFEDVEVEATQASGYEFSYWEAYVYTDCSSESLDNSILLMGTEEAENLVTIPYGGYDADLGDSYGKNVRLVAHFEEVSTYTVSYSKSKASCAQNGSGSWPANVAGITSGTVHSLPTDIELDGVDGYTFVGWTTNGTYTNSSTAPSPLYTASVTVTSNLTLYPVFSQGGTTGPAVSFTRKQSTAMEAGHYLIAIGQSGSQPCVGPNLNTTTYKLDPITQSVTASTASVTDRQAMWQVAASGTYWTIKNVYTNQYIALRRSNGLIVDNKIDMVSSVTNDAKWTVIIKGEHYYFQSAADANYYIVYKSSTWYAHDFTGKNDNTINNYSGSIYLYKSSTTPAAATSTYTITPECNTHTLTYDANGATSGTVPASETEYTSGSSVTVKGNSGDLAKTGYDFNGWKTAPSSGTAYAAGSTITMNADYTLYAQWLAHDITLELDANTANGGDTDGSGAVKYDATALTSITHATGQTGRTLLGYYTAPTAGTKVLNADGTYAAAAVTDYITSSKWTRDESPTTLHAQWRYNTYTVVFNKNATGPTGSMANQDFTYGTAQNLTTNNFTWSAHNFEGWATEPSGAVVYGNGAEVNNLTTTDGGTFNLYAVWTDKTYDDYKFTCVDIALTTEDTDPVLVTSRSGVNIMAKKKLLLTVDGTTGVIDLTSDGNVLKFYKKTTSAPIRYVELTGANRLNAPVTDQEVYVSYAPTTAGTGDFAYPRITVTQGANVRNYDGKVVARNLPDAVAIVAKVGQTWHALPANMATATNPEPVPVTVALEGGILKATGPSTVSYKLWPVATTNSAQDRFGTATGHTPATLFGDRLRFAGNDNKALWMNNSTGASTIKNDGAITAIGNHFATDAAYEWKVETTLADGNFTYQLTAENGTNTYDLRMKQSDFKWGTYANGETNVIYILPLIEKTPAELTVMEWGTNEIAISYPNGGNATAITAKIDNGATTDVTKTSLGGDMYRLTNVGDLQGNPGKTLTLDITESGSPKQVICRIPLIVTTTQNVTDLRGLLTGANATEKGNVANVTDVVIRKTGNNIGKLQTSGSTANVKFNNVYVYPAAKLNVTDNTRLSLNQLYLRGGYSFLSAVNSDNYKMPEAYIAANLTGSANIIYDFYIDNRYYYVFTLPYTVSLSNVHDETGSDDFKVWVKYYDGEQRASGLQVSGWKYYSGSDFTAGVGYEIAAKPRVTGRQLAIVRFPLGNTALTSGGEGEKTAVTVDNYGYDAYTAGTQTANNIGWNFVGNPFMSTWKNTSDWGHSYMQTGVLLEDKPGGNWNGTYVWKTEDVRYVTILNLFAQEYSQQASQNCELPPFQPFFIQVKDHNASFSMLKEKRIAKAPALMRNIQPVREQLIELYLNGSERRDNTGLLIGEEFSADYEVGDDLVKMQGDNQLALYTQTGGYDLAFNALNEELASQRIPIGFTAPTDGEYSISLNDDSDLREVESVILTDYETGLEIDLLAEDYVFDAVAEKNNDRRFTLNVRMRKWGDIGTDIEQQYGSGLLDDVRVMNSSTGLVLRGVPQDAAVYVYDMTGKLIESYLPAAKGQPTDSNYRRIELNGLPVGVYNIRVQTPQQGKTLRTIVEF